MVGELKGDVMVGPFVGPSVQEAVVGKIEEGAMVGAFVSPAVGEAVVGKLEQDPMVVDPPALSKILSS